MRSALQARGLRRRFISAAQTPIAIWLAVGAATAVPIIIAANSPQLQWRDPVYIASGFAGIVALCILLLQPLLALRALPCLNLKLSRRLHTALGFSLTVTIMAHVVGLWITSPPDVVDALLFRSPTPFSLWGVIAMWSVIAAAVLASLHARIPTLIWRRVHTALACITVAGTVAHALLIDGTMGTISKLVLCIAVSSAALWAIFKRKAWRSARRIG